MNEDFKFDERVAAVFDDMLQRSIPFYDEMQRTTVELARHFAQPESAVVDLGCSTGNTLLQLAHAIDDPTIALIGLDNSGPMLAKARAKLDAAGVLERCRLGPADLNEELNLGRCSVAIMNWTLQFVRPLYRDTVIRRIHDALVNRGCLIVLEKVLGNESLLHRLYIDLYHDFKRRNGYSQSEIAQKRESLENVLVPYRIDENLLLLERNGFAVRDVFFRWYNWAGFLGVKLVERTGA